MTATTFLTQRQLMSKNMPKDALSGPYAQQQKLLLYVLPIVFAVGGIAFPIGVLFYWTTSNLWTMGQQFYVIRNNPAPGTEAEQAKMERDKAKAIKKGLVRRSREPEPEPEPPRPSQRQQPQRQSRSQRKTASRPRQPAPDPETDPETEPESSREGVRARPGRPPASSNGQPPNRRPNLPSKGVPKQEQEEALTESDVDRVRDDRARSTEIDARRRADEAHEPEESRSPTRRRRRASKLSRVERLEQEGDIAADYLEELLDIADLDGDLDMDVEGDRAAVSIVGADLSHLVGARRRGARGPAGADPAGGLPRDR